MQQDSFDLSVHRKMDMIEVIKQHLIKPDHTGGVITGNIDYRKLYAPHYLIKA